MQLPITRTILLAGFIGAALIDLYIGGVSPLIFHSGSLLKLSQWDASNLLGRAAFHGGWGTALFGMFLHWIVATCWAAVFVMLYARKIIADRYALIAGALLGIVVMLVMGYLVVPLGHAPHGGKETLAGWINQVVAHVLFFGVPVAAVTRNVLRRENIARP